MPLVGEIMTAGLTARQLENEIEIRLKSGGYLVDPQVSIEVLNYRPFYIIGEVNNPGSYQYVNGMTVINAVALAGGFSYRADQDDIMINRGGSQGPKVEDVCSTRGAARRHRRGDRSASSEPPLRRPPDRRRAGAMSAFGDAGSTAVSAPGRERSALSRACAARAGPRSRSISTGASSRSCCSALRAACRCSWCCARSRPGSPRTGIDTATIGLFGFVFAPYTLKFLWAPLMDRLPLPVLTAAFGRRRSWLLLTQAVPDRRDLRPRPDRSGPGSLPDRADGAAGRLLLRQPGHRDRRLPDRDPRGAPARRRLGQRTSPATGSACGWHRPARSMLADVAGWSAAYAAMALLVLVGVATVLLNPEPPAPAPTGAPTPPGADGRPPPARPSCSCWPRRSAASPASCSAPASAAAPAGSAAVAVAAPARRPLSAAASAQLAGVPPGGARAVPRLRRAQRGQPSRW